uniref:Uncharacterized protein n=1 Tax=Anopheles funestus TaxID=62324 RepID=A0A182S2F6_ANOFN
MLNHRSSPSRSLQMAGSVVALIANMFSYRSLPLQAAFPKKLEHFTTSLDWASGRRQKSKTDSTDAARRQINKPKILTQTTV